MVNLNRRVLGVLVVGILLVAPTLAFSFLAPAAHMHKHSVARAHVARGPQPLLLRGGVVGRRPVRLMMSKAETAKAQVSFHLQEDQQYQPGFDKVLKHNEELVEHFEHLRQQDFFRYYAVDLLSSCCYFPTAEIPCDLDKCDVVEAEDIIEGMKERDRDEHDFRLDGWVRWDMPGDFTEYYDLYATTERWTGYDGSRVWRFIHQKICFQANLDDEDQAWKRDYNRLISGLHTAISTHILMSMGLEGEEFEKEYRRRIGDVPGAVANLHYAYTLVLNAVHETAPRLRGCTYMGTLEDVAPSMLAITSHPLLADKDVNLISQTMRQHSSSPSAQVWKARLRTRDLMGIMNCVQCNVCRLHGKVAALGIGVALQIVLGNSDAAGIDVDLEGRIEKLHRVEVAALMTTAAKFSTAVSKIAKIERNLNAKSS